MSGCFVSPDICIWIGFLPDNPAGTAFDQARRDDLMCTGFCGIIDQIHQHGDRGDRHLFMILVPDGDENRLNVGISDQTAVIGIDFDLGEFGISLPENFDHFRIVIADCGQFRFFPGKIGINEIGPKPGIDTDYAELDFHGKQTSILVILHIITGIRGNKIAKLVIYLTKPIIQPPTFWNRE